MTNKQVTIIIPTYCRHHSLSKVLRYWSSKPVEVLVVDGSPTHFPWANNYNSNPSIRYCHLPLPIEDRLAFAATNLQTPFAAILSDDEILLYNALEKAADYLSSHPSYSAVLGTTLAFQRRQNNLFCKGEYLSASKLTINSDYPSGRLAQRVRVTGNSIFYSLTRASIMKVALQFIASHSYTCTYIAEYQMEAILAGAGKIRVLNDLMWLRNRCGKYVTTPLFDRRVLFSSWILDPANTEELSLLKESFEAFFPKVVPTSNLSGEYFVQLFNDFEIASNPELSVKNRLEKLIYVTRNYSRASLRRLYSRTQARNFTTWFPANNLFQALQNAKVPYCYDDLKIAFNSLFPLITLKMPAELENIN